jgi:double-stranded uracil-DNA glycosylase
MVHDSRPPSRQEQLAAYGETVPDLIAPGLTILFCGINPSLYSAAVGLHFARPGNRFWPTLHRAGFTPRQLRPDEAQALLEAGYGSTVLVERATARADELRPDELVAGRERLRAKVARYRPRAVAMLGVTAYRTAFARPKAQLGLQPERIEHALLWVLPNPSGLNAHYSLDALARLYRQCREDVERAHERPAHADP